jgi:sterol desaturase/sphingolipid hydroxylase (fatty acid hydroxylase superfamily)
MDAGIAIAVTIAAMAAIIALRYLATSGLFAWLTDRRDPAYHTGLNAQIRREIGWSMLSAIIFAVPAGLVAWIWQEHGGTLIYTDPLAYPLWYMPVSLFAYLFAHDTWFYWTHRWMHRPRIFRVAHAVHHASRPPTAWAAMSFHPTEAITGAIIIPALVFVIPVHYGVLGLVLLVMTVMGVTNHMGWDMFPQRFVNSKLGNWLITASHHNKHHERYSCNYGLYFRFWDRVCGTDAGLSIRSARRAR